MIDQDHKLLSIPQFAEALGLKPSGIRRWVLLRKISYVKVGTRVRIPASEATRILQAGFVPAREERR